MINFKKECVLTIRNIKKGSPSNEENMKNCKKKDNG